MWDGSLKLVWWNGPIDSPPNSGVVSLFDLVHEMVQHGLVDGRVPGQYLRYTALFAADSRPGNNNNNSNRLGKNLVLSIALVHGPFILRFHDLHSFVTLEEYINIHINNSSLMSDITMKLNSYTKRTFLFQFSNWW